MDNKIHIKQVIQRCAGDKILPLCLVYIFSIVLHGHLSPGGGFQGGILTVAVVLLVYLGHGYVAAKEAIMPDLFHPLEGAALIFYIVLAFAGVLFTANFGQNFITYKGNIGDLYSAGTIFFMNATVAFDVMCASIVLSVGMLSVLFPQDITSKL